MPENGADAHAEKPSVLLSNALSRSGRQVREKALKTGVEPAVPLSPIVTRADSVEFVGNVPLNQQSRKVAVGREQSR
jgi:hypothetical protein